MAVALRSWLFALSLCVSRARVSKRTERNATAGRKSAYERHYLSICTLVAMRYEADYLLEWVAWHLLVGFARFYIYLDDRERTGAGGADTDGAFERRSKLVLDALKRQSNVTVFSMRKVGVHTQKQQLEHCSGIARRQSVWMANWDVDEAPALGDPPSVKRDRQSVPSVAMLLSKLPSRFVGVIVPRVVFGCAEHMQPLAQGSLALETFARRACDQSLHGGGKIIWRSDHLGQMARVRPAGCHALFAARRSAICTADGTEVGEWQTTSSSSSEGIGSSGGAMVNGSSPILTAAARAMRLHHLAVRSRAECESKATDATNGTLFVNARGVNNWWRGNASWFCEVLCPRRTTKSWCPAGKTDRSLAQYAGVLRRRRREMQGL